MAYVCRYVNIVTKTKSPSKGPLNRDEIQRAETVILRDVQRNAFTDEYAILWKARENSTTPSWKSLIPRSSLLFKRSPYMDENGLLILSGRIHRCRYVDPRRKRPILLPKRHRFTELIVDDVHRRYKHGGQETVVNEVRQRFDIPALRSAKMNELWKKWIKTYLPTLVRRTKWFESCKPIETGDVVLIVDENSPRNCWPRGRVERVVPSKDGVIRRVVIKTAKGTMLERPVVKLVSLNVAPRVIV
uniref:DUF5641 domain-containing protein n=1 Tax=Anopheles arabiensis TaxID=7173 RepID=A0A182HFN0_ANOAR